MMHLLSLVLVQICARFNQGFSICSSTHFPHRGNISLLLIIFGSTGWYSFGGARIFTLQFQSNREYLDFQDSPRCEGDPLILLLFTYAYHELISTYHISSLSCSSQCNRTPLVRPPKKLSQGFRGSISSKVFKNWMTAGLLFLSTSNSCSHFSHEDDLFSDWLLHKLLRWFNLHDSYVSYNAVLGNILNTRGKNTHETHRLSWFVHHTHPQTNLLLG